MNGNGWSFKLNGSLKSAMLQRLGGKISAKNLHAVQARGGSSRIRIVKFSSEKADF